MAGFDTKPNLSNDKFEQFSGETLTLSGRTEVHGILEIENGGVLRLDDGNQGVGKVMTSDVTGGTTWQDPQVTTVEFTGYTATTTADIDYISGETLIIGAPDTSVQFNNGDELSGSTNFTWDNTARELDIVGELAISGTSFLRANDGGDSVELGNFANASGVCAVACRIPCGCAWRFVRPW